MLKKIDGSIGPNSFLEISGFKKASSAAQEWNHEQMGKLGSY
jgi:hypothetical protein